MLLCVAVALLVPGTYKIGGFSLFDISIYVTLFISFLITLNKKNKFKLKKGIALPLWILLASVIFSYIINADSLREQTKFVESIGLRSENLSIRLSAYGLATILMIIGVYQFASTYITTIASTKLFIKTIIIIGAINALITIIVWYFETGGVFGRYNFLPPLEQSQGIHVFYMGIIFLIAFGFHGTEQFNTKIERAMTLITMFLTTFSTLTVMTRGGWFTFLATFIIYIMLARKSEFNLIGKYKALIPAGLIIFGIIFVIYTSQGVVIESFLELFSEGIENNTYSSTYMRFVLIEHGISLFLNNFLFGIGYGYYPAYSTVPVIVTGEELFVASPHNGIITMLSEGGIVGLIIYLWLCWSILKELLKAFKQASNKLYSIVSTIGLALIIIEIFLQFSGNSRILPIPTERVSVQSTFILWLIWSMAINHKRKISYKR